MTDLTYTYNESPHYSMPCECGLTIIGGSEKGLQTLITRHRQKGSIHLQWEKEKK